MGCAPDLRIVGADRPTDASLARRLFEEYADELGEHLCFQDFERELAELPGPYAPPEGMLLLAECNDQSAGCVALKDLGGGNCEMKRLYVRGEFRGRGLRRALAEAIIAEARRIGYARMRLDTLDRLTEATALYRSLRFEETPPYYDNPLEGVLYMARAL